MSRGRWCILLAVAGLALSYPVEDAAHGQTSTAESNESAEAEPQPANLSAIENSLNRIASEIEASRREPQTETGQTQGERDLAAQEGMWRWAMIAAVVASAMALLTFIGVVLIWRTLEHTKRAADYAGRMAFDTSVAVQAAVEANNEMREANEIAERNARRQMRPYVWVEAAWFEIQANGEPLAHIHMKNYGQTPALSYRGWKHTWVADFPLRGPLPEPDEGAVQMGTGVLAPGQSSEARQPHGLPLTQIMLDEIANETAALYAYGYGTYLNMFGKECFYRFIYFSHGEGFERGRFAAYMSGNVIDVD